MSRLSTTTTTTGWEDRARILKQTSQFKTYLAEGEVDIYSRDAYIHQYWCLTMPGYFLKHSSETSVHDVREEHLFFDRPEGRLWPKVLGASYDSHQKLSVCLL